MKIGRGEIRRTLGSILIAAGLLLVVQVNIEASEFMSDAMGDWMEQMDFQDASKWDAFWSVGGWVWIFMIVAISLPCLAVSTFGMALFMSGRHAAKAEQN